MEIGIVNINDEDEILAQTMLQIDGDVDITDPVVYDDIMQWYKTHTTVNEHDRIILLDSRLVEKLKTINEKIVDSNTEKIIYNKEDEELHMIDLTDFSTFENIDFME